MKNKKLLMPLAGIAALGSTLPIAMAVTSCGNKTVTTNSVVAVQEYGFMIGTERYCELTYSLTSPLADGQYLTMTHESTEEFTFYDPVVVNTNVTVYVKLGSKYKDGSLFDKGLKFICMDENKKEVWSQNVECIVGYNKVASYNGDQEVYTDEGEKTYTFTFDLAYNPEQYNRTVKAFINNSSYSEDTLKASITATKLTTTLGKTTLAIDVTLSKTDQLALWNGAEWAKFDLEVYGLNEDSENVWQASAKGIKLTYTSQMVAIPYAACTIDANGVLTKIDAAQLTHNENTLDLSKAEFANVTAIDDKLWETSGGTALDNIVGLRLNSKCATFGEAAFKNSKLVYIDLTQMPSSAEWFKTGEFGTDCFVGLPTEGTIKYNPNWTAAMKHRIKNALYVAGLTSSGWYDITWVTSYAELQNAFQTGGFIKLYNDIDIPATRLALGSDSGELRQWTEEIVVEVSSCLDLNGHKIESKAPVYYSTDEAEETAMIAIWNGAELVVEDSVGTGVMKAYDEEVKYTREGNTYCFNVHADNTERYAPSLLITGGNFYGTRSCIHNNGAQVEIDGGSFHLNKGGLAYWRNSCGNGAGYLLNCKGSAYKAGNSDFWIKGGKFYGWSFASGKEDYYSPALDPLETKTITPLVGEPYTVRACYFYDHNQYLDAADYDGDYELVDHKAEGTEEGAEGYLEVKLAA